MFGNKHPNNPSNLDARIKEESKLKYFSDYVRDKEITNRKVDFWEKNKPKYSLQRIVSGRYPLISSRSEYNKSVEQRRLKLIELQQIEKQQYQMELLHRTFK
ncbi:predicted protein [Naegleria gruberi]|uniref:Predicted protein n=1 Tax=Naegleria gruberi TaxID=5762 RepID=D2VIB9_NAEGR|nr:uncharacterized protein NAEGRDRAFT_68632 [Naegleria gruberi]EFC43570.1 predicted protein [Naegleria gruberi]|eukprot:XP_002676314.1 predicted protein [Naegleria gruberi strain NEG-M]